jgi:predicted nuclease with RNAse H fold
MSGPIVVGVDVGGARKGFHAVALSGRSIRGKTRSSDARVIADWCRGVDARVVAIDAPCGWSLDGRPRSAELALMRSGISCFSTPTQEAALAHPENYYGWMIAGLELYAALAPRYSLARRAAISPRSRACFEAFPQAIACGLAGAAVSAKKKNPVRRSLLRKAGIDESALSNIDEVDAAMCALMARLALEGNADTFGLASDGLIFVPREPLRTARIS